MARSPSAKTSGLSHGKGNICRADVPSGPAVNSTVFYSQDIEAATSITEVFGDGQRLTAVAVEYATEIANDALSLEQFSVGDRRAGFGRCFLRKSEGSAKASLLRSGAAIPGIAGK